MTPPKNTNIPMLTERDYAYLIARMKAMEPARITYQKAIHYTRNPSKKTIDQALKTYQEAVKAVKISEEDIKAELAYNED